MNRKITPSALAGQVQAPPSKSYAHRHLIAAALADAPTRIEGLALSEDIRCTIGCLEALGARMRDGAMHPVTARQSALMACGESGTTLRLLLPVAAALGVSARFVGDGRLPSRPLAPLIDALAARGLQADVRGLPLSISGRITPGRYLLPGDISSQFISGLLLALPLLDSSSVIQLETPLQSAGYVRMTEHALEAYGISCARRADGYMVPGGQHYHTPGTVRVEGDWSNAAVWLAAGALHGEITVEGLAKASAQGDRAIADLLARFGAQVRWHGGSLRVRQGSLRGIEADVTDIPDLVPVLAAVAAAASGITRLTGAGRLRMKESDRLQSTQAMLGALGAHAEAGEDTLAIYGGTGLHGGVIDGFGDHRIVMAGALAASLARGESVITGAEAVAKSYPDFFAQFEAMGGRADVVDAG